MSRPAPASSVIVVVLKGYPRLSETFIAQELAALERRGLRLAIASLRQPYDRITHPVHAEVRAPVNYLPEYVLHAPLRLLKGHAIALARAPRRYLGSAAVWLRDLRRDPTVNRIRRFGQAGVLAAELPHDAGHLHAHFLHTPASVARYAARMAGLSYSLSAHAKDVWTRPRWELAEKIGEARFAVTCTAENRNYLAALARGTRVELVYHGLDPRLFAPPATVGSTRNGSDPRDPVRLLTVGRFQPKKGFDVVLRALAQVRDHARLTIVGYGPLEGELRRLAGELDLDARLHWTGALDQPSVRALYRESDLFVLAPRVAPDGDRDGLPNVVVEALSQGLPVVATRVAALPEIVEEDVTGRLVPPDDPRALAAAIQALVRDPAARRRLSVQGLRRIAAGWDLEDGADQLFALFDEALGARTVPAPVGDRPASPAGAVPGS